jgi:hypothetical protein
MDDYYAILHFLNSYIDAGALQKVELVLSRHNEHQIVLVRLAVLTNYYLYNQINFIYLTFIAAVFLICLLWLFVRDGISKNLSWTLIPFTALLLNLQYGTILIWPMAALQHFSTVLFVFLTLKLFCSSTSRLAAYARFPVLYLCVLSGGANIFVIPLIYCHYLLTRKYKKLISLSLNTIIILAMVFVVNDDFYLSSSAHKNIIDTIIFATLFLGHLSQIKAFGLLLGITGLIGILAGIKLRFYQRYPEYFYFAIFIVLVAGSAGVSRSDYGLDYAMEGKYSVYANAFWLSLIMMYTVFFKQRPFSPVWRTLGVGAVSICCLVLCALSWINNKKEIDDLARINWVIYPSYEVAKDILLKSKQHGIYNGERYIINAK